MDDNDLVFYKEPEKMIYSGGVSIKNWFLNNGLSPLNQGQTGGSNRVSDLFSDLVVPLPLYYQSNGGGSSKNIELEEDNVVDEDLHEKLLGLVTHHVNNIKQKRKTKKNNKVSVKRKTKKNK
jgi:hypothetical protein